jgi:biopolymer transport protein ExbD
MIRATQPDSAAGPRLGADLTPLIDVLFMLIVFMVLTANSAQLAIEADLPSTEENGLSLPSPDAPPLTVAIRAEGSAYSVDKTDYSDWQSARAALQSSLDAAPDRPVVLAAEPNAPVQRLIDAMAYLQQAGIPDAQILLEAR